MLGLGPVQRPNCAYGRERVMVAYLFVAGMILSFAPVMAGSASAQTATLDSLQGAEINTGVRFNGTFKNPKGTVPGTILVTMQIRVGPGDALKVKYARTTTVHTPAGNKTGTLTRNISGKIGTPSKSVESNSVWLLEGDQLVNLNVREVGGFKTTITFGRAGEKLSCKVTSSYVPEVGAGLGTTTSAATGGKVQILAQKQTSSDCKVNSQ
jgi:hypothetical protein